MLPALIGYERSARRATIAFSTIMAAAIVGVSADARANCAMPTTYNVTVAGSTVTICPSNFEGRGCPDADGMLRFDGTETVRIADRCSGDAGPESCYVDECVPKGAHQYGFARPYDCCEYCCGTYSYATATVADDQPPQCSQADAGNGVGDASADASVSGPPPWPPLICNYVGGGGLGGLGGSAGSGGSNGGNGGGSGGATGGEAGTSAGAGGSNEATNDGCSCTMPGRVSATQFVLGANGVLVLLGLLLGRRGRS